jgi:hypothetical protein
LPQKKIAAKKLPEKKIPTIFPPSMDTIGLDFGDWQPPDTGIISLDWHRK